MGCRVQSPRKPLPYLRAEAGAYPVGVRVQPHRLRHTCATKLLNAGCRITSIQKPLGHRGLNSTMVYAPVHDRTVAEDYYAAMTVVESRVKVGPGNSSPAVAPLEDGRGDLLPDPALSTATRLSLVGQMRLAVNQALPELHVPACGHGPPTIG